MSRPGGSYDPRQLDDLVSRARRDLKDWTDAGQSDPGVALLELFAYLGELLAGYSERLAAEGYLEGRAEPARAVCGVHRGVVVDNVDPLVQQRLFVRVPDVTGDAASWAAACVPVPGSSQVPGLGDQVWVAFEAGDPLRPVWLGRRGGAAP